MISFKQLYKYIIYWENNSSIRFICFIFEKNLNYMYMNMNIKCTEQMHIYSTNSNRINVIKFSPHL